MSSAIDKLKEIGAQKIYEQTHVPKGHIQAILHNSFEGLNKVQISGFISILEREYKVDLTSTKESSNVYFSQLSENQKNENKEIFVAVREKKSNNNFLYIIILIIIVIALYFSLKNSIVQDEKIDNTLIEDVKEKVVQEENSSKVVIIEKKLDIVKPNEEIEKAIKEKVKKVKVIKKPEVTTIKSLEIIPKSKVWIGYIDIANNKHYQLVVKHSLELDASKDWLLLFGHNQVKLKLNDEVQDIKQSIRYSYIDSKLKAITLNEFKKLNKGSKW